MRASIEQRATQSDIGLRVGGEAAAVGVVFGLVLLSSGSAGLVVFLAVFRGGRGRGKGTFCTVAENDSAHSPQEAANAKRMLKRLRPVAIIKPRAVVSPATRISAGPLAMVY
jgi:hypothetical protein